jgi:DNA-binding transcriptional LysR family regulator
MAMVDTNWDLFRLFFAVVRAGSVNRAARELGMSQPTLSRRLGELERYIGAPLFFRVSSGVTLTQEGEDLHRSAHDMVRSFETFQRDLRHRLGDRSTAVRISATEGLTKHWLLPRVQRLQTEAGDIHLEISSSVHQQNLASLDLDFVIRMGHPGDDQDLIGKRVATVGFGIFAARSYLARHPPPRSVADLAGHDIISSGGEFPVLRSERSGAMRLLSEFRAAADARSRLKVMPMATSFAAAAEGLGLAFLAIPFAHAEGLVRVLPHESATLDVWLLRRRETDLRKLNRQVRRFLESEFATSRDWLLGRKASAP